MPAGSPEVWGAGPAGGGGRTAQRRRGWSLGSEWKLDKQGKVEKGQDNAEEAAWGVRSYRWQFTAHPGVGAGPSQAGDC